MVDYAYYCAHPFSQPITEGSQTIEDKHEFERFAINCSVQIEHYHADKKYLMSVCSEKVT